MKRQIRRVTIILIIFLFFSTPAATEEDGNLLDLNEARERVIDRLLQDTDIQRVNRVVERLNQDMDDILPEFNLWEFIRNPEVNWQAIVRVLGQVLFREVWSNFILLGELVILAILGAVLTSFQSAFSEESLSQLVNGLIVLVIVILGFESFEIAVTVGREAIQGMVDFMDALLPVLLALLVSMGAVTSAALLKPVSFLVVVFLSNIIKNVIFPLIFFALVLGIISSITDTFKVSRLGELIRKASMTFLGLFMVIFVAVMTFQTNLSTAADSLTIRSTKYLAGNLIPVVGKMFADALDLIVNCSLIVKSAINFFGVLFIFIIISFPLLKIVALILIYKLAGAIIQPVSSPVLVNALDELGNSLIMIVVTVSSVAIMYYILISILAGAANMAVMLR